MATPEMEDGWEQRYSRSKPGTVYYVHPGSGRKQLEMPMKKRRLDSGVAAPGGDGGGADGLFAGLPEAASGTCAPKEHLEERKKTVKSVRCSHILKKHEKSRKPRTWRGEVITRSVEEATHKIKEMRKRLVGCETDKERHALFEQLARKESDCSSAQNGGSLGRFERGKMQKAFEEASFALEVNELSGIVNSDSGVHLILRLE